MGVAMWPVSGPSARNGYLGPHGAADRVGFSKGEIIISVDGVKPTSIQQLEELLSGETEKRLITRHWSAIDNQFYDFYVMDYEPYYLEAF